MGRQESIVNSSSYQENPRHERSVRLNETAIFSIILRGNGRNAPPGEYQEQE